MNIRKFYWRLFNFLVRRVIAMGFIFGGAILVLSAVPNILSGGTVQFNGQSTDDIVIRCFSVFFPLIVVVLGIFLFRANPYYPSSVKE